MNISDLMNAGFEGCGAAFNVLNIRQILKEKQVRGVSLVPTIVFTCWGIFNIPFYLINHLPISSIAAVAMGLVNGVWVYLALKYTKWQIVKTFKKKFCLILRALIKSPT